MPPREEFPTKGLEGAPSNDIGVIKESMMNVLKESNTKKIDKKRRKDEFLSQLTEEEDEHEGFIDEVSAIRQATRESIQSQHEWHRREEFRRSTGGWDNIYEEGRSSHGSAREHNRERTSKSIPVATEVGQGVKLPTPYEVSDVYLESEYQRVHDWVNVLKTHWKELGATLMCDGWTNSLNQMHIINFLVYCSKGTIFWKSVDVSSVRSRDVEFYYRLLDSVVEEIGENYIVQIVTDNEAAMKAAGKKLMLKRQHLYWTSCAAHCLDLCLEDIGKKPSVAKVLDEAKKEFKESKWGKQKSGPAYEAKKIVLGKDFWKKANDLIKVYEPLVRVLRLVDSDEKPTMGFIYEAVDRAKRAIQQNCRYFTEYEKIIDNRWNFMHSDLHSAGKIKYFI
ncbi:uncharacterized protein [Gossypium hirsutum]|uniref:DUF659 domain-containing protein n=1 Tax=Gossypium hirsutum TaxID=3635 RepID=A0ABM3ASR2_GOSHI|nr:uncharacterized protein LOC107915286 [Gossypium hirsutum]